MCTMHVHARVCLDILEVHMYMYSTGQRKVKRVPRNLRVYYAGTRLFYAECGDSLRV